MHVFQASKDSYFILFFFKKTFSYIQKSYASKSGKAHKKSLPIFHFQRYLTFEHMKSLLLKSLHNVVVHCSIIRSEQLFHHSDWTSY